MRQLLLHSRTHSIRILVAAATGLAVLALTGCGIVNSSDTSGPPAAPSGHAVSGRVMGGQQPISGATIQLYAVNATTQRGSSSPLLTATVTTDPTGNFSIAGKYACPVSNPGALVYFVATGGNAGAGTNSSIAEMATIGACNSITSGTYIQMTEVTTVASVYALAPFMADYAHVGATPAQLGGITNAFANVNSLTNINTGLSPGPSAPANATIPSTEINTLADIVSACVNGTAAGACSILFSNAVPLSGSTQPTDTIGALLNIATNPGANVSALFGLVVAGAPFQPALLVAPSDWTVAVKLTSTSLKTPYGIAIDASGNAWVTNETGSAVSEFSANGTALTGSGSSYTFSGAQGLTIDLFGNIWVANTGGNNVIKLTSAGALSKNVTNFTFNAPIDIAADARGNIWIANFLAAPSTGTSLTVLNSAGNFTNGLTDSGQVARPTAVAVDPSGNVWLANSSTNTLIVYSKSIVLASTISGYTDNSLQGPGGIAFDSSGNAWVTAQVGPEISGFNSTGASLSTTPVYTAAGAKLSQPTGIATDSAGTIWTTNSTTTGSLSEFTAATGAPVATGQLLGTLNTPVQVAVDPSGNLWTANSGDNSVSLFVGLGAPTVTPLVARTN